MIVFTRSALPLILKAFDKEVNCDGVIVDSKSKLPVLSPEGDRLTQFTFGGIAAGGAFLKKDLLTAIKLSEGKYL